MTRSAPLTRIRALEAGSEEEDQQELFASAACALDDVQLQARVLMRRLNQLEVALGNGRIGTT